MANTGRKPLAESLGLSADDADNPWTGTSVAVTDALALFRGEYDRRLAARRTGEAAAQPRRRGFSSRLARGPDEPPSRPAEMAVRCPYCFGRWRTTRTVSSPATERET
ncbi:hypothetical protein ABZZ79_30280 [Streptomyces sp. NPDC006458]|uniref:hypothetical protein n=1 Tax=Streptomyces sp. NPDC006458 TaxID=3154302 RepID=UPI0033A73D11